MITRYSLVGLLYACLVLLNLSANGGDRLQQSREKNLKEAIEATDFFKVSELLKKGVVTQENKKEFVDAAEEKILFYENSMSIWTSKKDAARALGGAVLAVLGIGSFWYGQQEIERKKKELADEGYYYSGDDEAHFLLGGALGVFWGGLMVLSGSKKIEGQRILATSEQIFELIKKA